MNYIHRCQQLMETTSLDAIVIQSQPNMRYFSGFTGDSGSLLIGSHYRLLLTDFRYTEQAEQQSPDYAIVEFARGEHISLLEKAIDEHQAKRVGFEEQNLLFQDVLQLQEMKDIEWIPISGNIQALRIIKTDDELNLMRQAGKITDDAFSHILSFIKEGMSEIDIALELEFFMRKNGADAVSFSPIVASGENGALPHAVPTKRHLQNGDMITMDFGCRVQGYCSDMTRTIALGSLASEQENVYNICLEAQQRAVELASTNCLAKELDAVARNFIHEHGFGDYFGHGLGHGVGLDIHESPTISPTSVQALQESMVFSIEPGVYIPQKYGVRIEDFGVLTQLGYQSFVTSTKELIRL